MNHCPGLKFQLIQIFPVTNFCLAFWVAVLEFLQAGATHLMVTAGPSCAVATPARTVIAKLHHLCVLRLLEVVLLSTVKTLNNHQGYFLQYCLRFCISSFPKFFKVMQSQSSKKYLYLYHLLIGSKLLIVPEHECYWFVSPFLWFSF